MTSTVGIIDVPEVPGKNELRNIINDVTHFISIDRSLH
jgi:hypothetical protein